MRKLGYELLLYGIAFVLLFLFGRKSKEDKAYERAGMIIVQMPAGYSYLVLAAGIFMFLFVSLFAYLCFMDGGWEEAGSMMLVAFGISLFVVFLGVGVCIYQKKNKIMYNRDKVRICRVFGETIEMSWWQLGRMVKSGGSWTGRICKIYDRNEQLLIRINSKWENFDSFCQYASQRIQTDSNWQDE